MLTETVRIVISLYILYIWNIIRNAKKILVCFLLPSLGIKAKKKEKLKHVRDKRPEQFRNTRQRKHFGLNFIFNFSSLVYIEIRFFSKFFTWSLGRISYPGLHFPVLSIYSGHVHRLVISVYASPAYRKPIKI